jgi:hypothetical protein
MWPNNLLDAFDDALQNMTLVEGYTKATALNHFLDSAAKMAVWRCKGDPASLEPAFFWPYTPIGHLTNTGLGGAAIRFTLAGDKWGPALELLKAFIRTNAEDICRTFKDEPIPYPCEI